MINQHTNKMLHKEITLLLINSLAHEPEIISSITSVVISCVNKSAHEV
jgi:hypothetical protein